MYNLFLIVLLMLVFVLVLKRAVSGLTNGGGSCLSCPTKPADTYYTSVNGCETGKCNKIADCPNVQNGTKTLSECQDATTNWWQPGGPGVCGVTCNYGYNNINGSCVAAQQCQVYWGNWGPCSSTCGQGQQTRTGTITQYPGPGGDPCPDLTQTQTCRGNDCNGGGPGQGKENRPTPIIAVPEPPPPPPPPPLPLEEFRLEPPVNCSIQ